MSISLGPYKPGLPNCTPYAAIASPRMRITALGVSLDNLEAHVRNISASGKERSTRVKREICENRYY